MWFVFFVFWVWYGISLIFSLTAPIPMVLLYHLVSYSYTVWYHTIYIELYGTITS